MRRGKIFKEQDRSARNGKKNGPVSRVEGIAYAQDPKVASLVFICGLHRSGTTLLERLLASRYQVAYLRSSAPESEGQHMQQVYSPAHKFGGLGRFAFSRAMKEELVALDDYDRHRAQILDGWRRYVVGNEPVLLEKSPPNLMKIWWLRRVFPNSRFIILTRDPRAVSAATQRWSKTSLPELMLHWNVAYSCAMADYCEDDCIITSYEALTDQPEAEILRLGEFLSLAPRSDVGEMEPRHTTLENTNSKYIEAHDSASYGQGVWDSLGYRV
jgi:hypothetical protein